MVDPGSLLLALFKAGSSRMSFMAKTQSHTIRSALARFRSEASGDSREWIIDFGRLQIFYIILHLLVVAVTCCQLFYKGFYGRDFLFAFSRRVVFDNLPFDNYLSTHFVFLLPLKSGHKRPQQVMAPFRLNWPNASSM